MVRWAERIGYRELHDLKAELINARDTYRNLVASELALKQKFKLSGERGNSMRTLISSKFKTPQFQA